MVDVKKERAAGRKPTSKWERRWPVYLGIGIPALIAGGMLLHIIIGKSVSLKSAIGIFLFLAPLMMLFFVPMAAVLIYVFSSVRQGAETLGNLTFVTATNWGFRIGAAIGFGLFLWFTPEVFGDPFTGNRSAPSSIVAQLMLKALGFMGLAGTLGSRLEKAIRPAAKQKPSGW